MLFDIKTLATINLLIQALLLVAVMVAAYLAKRKRQLIRHCRIVRWAVVVQLLSIFSIMLPSMAAYRTNPAPPPFRTEMLVHGSLGILLVLLWGYINLAVMGKVRVLGKLTMYMWTALLMWVLSFLLGLHLYFRIYLG